MGNSCGLKDHQWRRGEGVCFTVLSSDQLVDGWGGERGRRSKSMGLDAASWWLVAPAPGRQWGRCPESGGEWDPPQCLWNYPELLGVYLELRGVTSEVSVQLWTHSCVADMAGGSSVSPFWWFSSSKATALTFLSTSYFQHLCSPAVLGYLAVCGLFCPVASAQYFSVPFPLTTWFIDSFQKSSCFSSLNVSLMDDSQNPI